MATVKEINSKITARWLRENLAYEPETGAFTWKVRGMGRARAAYEAKAKEIHGEFAYVEPPKVAAHLNRELETLQ